MNENLMKNIRAIMEFLPSTPTAAAAAIIAVLIFFSYLLWTSKINYTNGKNSIKRSQAPEVSGARPLLGHLHLLGGPKPPHITLGNLADKHGPIFCIRLGMHKALIVSNSEIGKECFTANDRAFINRPKFLAAELMGYNNAMFGFSSYLPYWRQVRKIATLEVLSNYRLEMLKPIRESEMRTTIKELFDLWVNNRSESGNVLVEMRRWFGSVNMNMVFKMVVGKRYTEIETPQGNGGNDPVRKAMRNFFELTGAFAIADALPFLRWLDLGGHERAMKKTAKQLDRIIVEWLEEHKQRRRNSGKIKGDEQDFMDTMLSVLDGAKDLPSYDADTINEATCLALVLGGSDTTTVTLTWCLSLLLNHPDVLKKAQYEIDACVGRQRRVQESDTKNLIYLQAILKETMRLYPAAPLSVPHEAVEDCTTAGYHVPAGTRLIVNLYKLHRDPNVWSSPEEFWPERFLSTHKYVDVRGQNFELIPFGSGRRVCPGISFALQVMQLILANLLHGFEITTPTGEAVDMGESPGLTNLKATPLEVVLTPRFPGHLYE